MPYSTPTAYLSRFGLTEAAELLADEQRELTPELLQAAIANAAGTAWPPSITTELQTVALAALARLQRALQTSSSFMDGYLRAAMRLPLAPGDAIAGTLEECCLALTRCNLADDCDNATDRADRACEQWRAWLLDVSRGRVQLVNDGGDTPPRPAGVRTGQAVSAYPWHLYGGVR